jgi:hypothetical protein
MAIKQRLADMWDALTESIVLGVLWEIIWVIVFAWFLAAILAFPLWGLITTFLWPSVGYLGAWYVSALITSGICIVIWVVDLARAVRL